MKGPTFIAGVCVLVLLGISCKRRVEVRPTSPMKVIHCEVPADLQGRWVSDSIHIVSDIDTLDSSVVNKSPTITYVMDLTCGEDSLFLLWYQNFAGVRTEAVRSSNFLATGSAIYAFSHLDAFSDTAEASFALPFVRTTTERLTATLIERPNSGQLTETIIFFRKD